MIEPPAPSSLSDAEFVMNSSWIYTIRKVQLIAPGFVRDTKDLLIKCMGTKEVACGKKMTFQEWNPLKRVMGINGMHYALVANLECCSDLVKRCGKRKSAATAWVLDQYPSEIRPLFNFTESIAYTRDLSSLLIKLCRTMSPTGFLEVLKGNFDFNPQSNGPKSLI